MKTRQELKMLARENIKTQKKVAILLILVLCALIFVLGMFTLAPIVLSRGLLRVLRWSPLVLVYWAGLLVIFVMAVNMTGEYIKMSRREPARLEAMFTELKVHFGRKLGGMLWVLLWITLWALISAPVILLALFLMKNTGRGTKLLVLALMGPVHIAALVPAIIKGFSYFLTPYILADCPDVTAREALRLSRRMMDGHKKELFVMMLSFIGWMLLSVLTLGILYVAYVGPYMYTSCAGFYTEVRAKVLAEGTVAPEELAPSTEGRWIVIETEAEPEIEAVVLTEPEIEVEVEPEEDVEIEEE